MRFCWPTIVFFTFLFERKKTGIDILRRCVQFSARELRSETISCVFGWCQYQNKPRSSWSLHFIQLYSILYNFVPELCNVISNLIDCILNYINIVYFILMHIKYMYTFKIYDILKMFKHICLHSLALSRALIVTL